MVLLYNLPRASLIVKLSTKTKRSSPISEGSLNFRLFFLPNFRNAFIPRIECFCPLLSYGNRKALCIPHLSTLSFWDILGYQTGLIFLKLFVAFSISLLGCNHLLFLFCKALILKKIFLNSRIIYSTSNALPLLVDMLNISTLYFLFSSITSIWLNSWSV